MTSREDILLARLGELMEWKSTRSGDEEEEEGEEKVGGPEIWIGIISVQNSSCQFRRHLLTSAGIRWAKTQTAPTHFTGVICVGIIAFANLNGRSGAERHFGGASSLDRRGARWFQEGKVVCTRSTSSLSDTLVVRFPWDGPTV